jgi:hypothetical protein
MVLQEIAESLIVVLLVVLYKIRVYSMSYPLGSNHQLPLEKIHAMKSQLEFLVFKELLQLLYVSTPRLLAFISL